MFLAKEKIFGIIFFMETEKHFCNCDINIWLPNEIGVLMYLLVFLYAWNRPDCTYYDFSSTKLLYVKIKATEK
jgi:hypothetical protein